jgi:hypothetical protein
MTRSSNPVNGVNTPATAHSEVTLEMRPERRLIGPGSHRHIDFRVHVTPSPNREQTERPPVAVGLVLDRSGSMHGEKIETGRRAGLALLDRLQVTSMARARCCAASLAASRSMRRGRDAARSACGATVCRAGPGAKRLPGGAGQRSVLHGAGAFSRAARSARALARCCQASRCQPPLTITVGCWRC